MTDNLSQEYLKEIFDYCDGSLIWKLDPSKPKKWNTRLAGKAAGYRNPTTGYLSICINPSDENGLSSIRNFMAHRLVFCWHHGFYPETVDHINGDRSDDRIENLRAASYSENAANWGSHSRNTTGVLGVRKHRDGHYETRLSFKKKRYQIGSFKTLEEAKIAYDAASRRILGEWKRGASID